MKKSSLGPSIVEGQIYKSWEGIRESMSKKNKRVLKKRVRQKEIDPQMICANNYAKELRENATEVELRFMEIAKRKGLNLAFQVPIRIKNVCNQKTGKMGIFYIVDFLDKKKKIVIEIDGSYHNNWEQRERDAIRTRHLEQYGYKVYRITNGDVFAGRTTAFLYTIYPHLNKTGFKVAYGVQK